MTIYDVSSEATTHNDIKIVFGKLKSLWDCFCGSILFIFENSRKRYQYVRIGEKYSNKSNQTILQYRIVGKRHILEMAARDICNSKKIIGKFHPLDVRIISFIAGADQILEIEESKRKVTFNKLKKDIFNI